MCLPAAQCPRVERATALRDPQCTFVPKVLPCSENTGSACWDNSRVLFSGGEHGGVGPSGQCTFGMGTRYLRVHTGRTWRDCLTPQFDKIYDSQKFCSHDKFMLWGQKGRTLYTVHEFDTFQLTFIIVGYGGTGKSTLMTVMQKFWPAHLRGVLSSNIEQKFGMSQVLQKGRVRAIFCNEVSEDLQLVQEEWQTSCSGEEGSYAVKHESPWTGVCKACHFWVGNGFPKHWKNNNNQVSRRLCGVLMDTPIQPRDGNVLEEIDKIMGTVQRKMVLAYFDMLEQHARRLVLDLRFDRATI